MELHLLPQKRQKKVKQRDRDIDRQKQKGTDRDRKVQKDRQTDRQRHTEKEKVIKELEREKERV